MTTETKIIKIKRSTPGFPDRMWFVWISPAGYEYRSTARDKVETYRDAWKPRKIRQESLFG